MSENEFINWLDECNMWYRHVHIRINCGYSRFRDMGFFAMYNQIIKNEIESP